MATVSRWRFPPVGCRTSASNPAKPNEIQVFLLDPSADRDVRKSRCGRSRRLKEAERDFDQGLDRVVRQGHQADLRRLSRSPSRGSSTRTVGGHPATEIVADFTDDGKKMRMLGVAVIGEKSAATLRFTAEADKFDELRKDFDAIVESFRLD